MRPTFRRPIMTALIAVLAVPWLAVPASAVNYVPNPGFETCVQDLPPGSWAPFGADLVKCDNTQANTGAFSLKLSHPSDTLVRAQSECVVVPPSTLMQMFRFAYQTPAASPVVQVALSVQSFTGTDCTGSNGTAATGAGFKFGTPIVTDGDWHTLPNFTGSTDAATHSVRFLVSFQVSAGSGVEVHFDDLEFGTTSATTSTTTTPGSTSTSTTGATTSTT